MERLTARDIDGNVVQLTVSSTGRAFHSDEIWQRLAAYEETGLTPGDIQRVKYAVEELYHLAIPEVC